MHLKCLEDYHNANFSIRKGETTEEREDISADMKTYLFETFPNWFEPIQPEVKVKTPEDGLKIMTKEAEVVTKDQPKVAAKKGK